MTEPTETPQPALQGLVVGAYTLARPIGRGGMGSVWLAHRNDGRFEGQVAIKLMDLRLLESAGLERFQREGSVLARLTHPGIARLLDAGVASTNQPYLVLEYVDGVPIDEFVAAKGVATPGRIRLALQVLDAVAHAHASLIVHRDIKPSNILVTPDRTVKLLDFGIAKLLGDSGGELPKNLTVEGGRVFTPAFAAPEQLFGDPVTTATDVYSVGVLLHLLLSGQLVSAKNPLAQAQPLGLGDLDRILAKAMAREPSDRYVTAAAFADDLRRYLAHEPVLARPQSLGYRARKFIQRHRIAVSLAGLAVGGLIGATLFALGQMRAAQRERNETIRANRLVNVMSELQGVLAADPIGPDGNPLPMAGRIDLAERVLKGRFGDQPWLVATAMVDLAGRFFEVGDLDANRVMLGRAYQVARDAQLPDEAALALCSRSIGYWLQDRLDSARADIDLAQAALGGRPSVDLDARLLCLEAEGKWLQAKGHADSGITLLERAVIVGDSSPSAHRRLSVRNALAEVFRLSGRTRQAVPLFRAHLAELERTGYGDTEAYPSVMGFVAVSLIDLGEFAALDSTLHSAIAVRQAGRPDARVARQLAFMYGQAKLKLGEVDSAAFWINRALEDSERGPISPSLDVVHTELLIRQGRLVEAKALAPVTTGRPRGRHATAVMLRAEIRAGQGDRPGAQTMLERELATLLSDGEPRLTHFALPLLTAGTWRLAAGDWRGADSLARLAATTAAIDSLATSRSGLVGRAELLIAEARAAGGDSAAVRDALTRAHPALENGYGPGNAWSSRARLLGERYRVR